MMIKQSLILTSFIFFLLVPQRAAFAATYTSASPNGNVITDGNLDDSIGLTIDYYNTNNVGLDYTFVFNSNPFIDMSVTINNYSGIDWNGFNVDGVVFFEPTSFIVETEDGGAQTVDILDDGSGGNMAEVLFNTPVANGTSLNIYAIINNPNLFTLDFQPSPVPVPAAVWLFGSGLIGLIGIARRKKS